MQWFRWDEEEKAMDSCFIVGFNNELRDEGWCWCRTEMKKRRKKMKKMEGVNKSTDIMTVSCFISEEETSSNGIKMPIVQLSLLQSMKVTQRTQRNSKLWLKTDNNSKTHPSALSHWGFTVCSVYYWPHVHGQQIWLAERMSHDTRHRYGQLWNSVKLGPADRMYLL